MFALTCTRFKDCTTLQCCQPCRFPHELGRFSVELRFFLKTCKLLVFGLVSIEICLFLGLCLPDFFFSSFMVLLQFQFTATGILGMFL